MTAEKPQVDLIGVYWTFVWLDCIMTWVWSKLNCLSDQVSWEILFVCSNKEQSNR